MPSLMFSEYPTQESYSKFFITSTNQKGQRYLGSPYKHQHKTKTGRQA
jgi:hypothetical protein